MNIVGKTIKGVALDSQCAGIVFTDGTGATIGPGSGKRGFVIVPIHPECVEDVTAPRKHAHYFRNVQGLKEVDIYRFLDLFEVTDQAAGHAIKKLMCAGRRGAKDARKDIQEAIDTLTRRIEMFNEDEK